MNRWFPDVHSVVRRRNPNWLNSAWLGVSLPVLYLPQVVWSMIVKPILTFVGVPLMAFLFVMVRNIFSLVFAIVMTFVGGLLGILSVNGNRGIHDNA